MKYGKELFIKDVDINFTYHWTRFTFIQKWMSTFGDARLCAKICGCTINNILGIYSEVTEDEMMNMYKKIETLDKIKMISKSES